jgi:uncharacterized repeat protein (TIGR03803 family)
MVKSTGKSDGKLYGMTRVEGSSGRGVIFSSDLSIYSARVGDIHVFKIRIKAIEKGRILTFNTNNKTNLYT